MQTAQQTNFQEQIELASQKARNKKALYLYDEYGYKNLLGVFNKETAKQIRCLLERKRMINRLAEFDIRTTEPDTEFNFS